MKGRAVALIRDDDLPVGRPPSPPVESIAADRPLGPLSTDDGRIVNELGQTVRLHGVNWFGLETRKFVPHGLWKREWRSMLRQKRALGFNIIRLPFSNELLRGSAFPTGIDFHINPDLRGLTGLEIMDKVIAYAGMIGMRVILDNHRITAGDGHQESGLWHAEDFSEDRWVEDWRFIAERYRGMPSVIGADLFNEPHGIATWGGGGPNDWRRTAERAGNAILDISPDWLIIVEGVAYAEGSRYWDGGNLASAGRLPVRLNRPGQLVYSTHLFPASVYDQPWLRNVAGPEDLERVWPKHWAFLYEERHAPVLIGEFGSHLRTEADRAWMRALIRFLKRPAAQGRVAWTYWSWNPNSGDTGGILQDDWASTHDDKLAKIASLLPEAGDDLPGPTDSVAADMNRRGLHAWQTYLQPRRGGA